MYKQSTLIKCGIIYFSILNYLNYINIKNDLKRNELNNNKIK